MRPRGIELETLGNVTAEEIHARLEELRVPVYRVLSAPARYGNVTDEGIDDGVEPLHLPLSEEEE